MPDKHEVGGSSPLGPTNRTKRGTNSIKKAKAAFLEARRRDKFLIGGSSPLGPTSAKAQDGDKAKPNNSYYGGVAQLGEHLPCKQGVMGSNPIISTKRESAKKCSLKTE